MSLAKKVAVNAHYTRSVNLERDADSPRVVRSYIPTTRALQTLVRIAGTLKQREAPRAWSLVGPYGSGKSSFAAFLTYLLAAPKTEQAHAAQQVLEHSDSTLANTYQTIQTKTGGHCRVLLTGSPEPLSRRLAHAFAEGATAFWAGRTGRKPDIIEVFRRLADQDRVQVSEMLDAVEKLQDALARSGGNGVLVVIDELGKFLEYEARHYGANDIFLLQSLAERACGTHPTKLTLLVLLHQTMDQYAKGLGETLRTEWAKVQGRFENVPFIESAEQVLRIVATAFSHDLSDAEQSRVKRQAAGITKQLTQIDALPNTLDLEAASALFARCYPLHPLSAMLLPTLCQKVAQNERTLFSYLGSHEPHGFGDSIGRLSKIGDWIYPWEIYEYFILNQPTAVVDHYTHRRWAEVVTAVERLGDAPQQEVQLLKSIGLLNIIGTQGGFKASNEVVNLCLPDASVATKVVRTLSKKTVLQFRKFSGEYRVWEGSDFDLDAAVEDQKERLGRFNLADMLNERHALPPLVARRYTINNGALRYFVPIFANSRGFRKLPEQSSDARIVLFLAEGQVDRQLFERDVKGYFSDRDIVVEHLNAEQLREAVREVRALEAVGREAQELNSDPVAQREFKDRYATASAKEQELLGAIIDEPATSYWYWQNDGLSVFSKRSLQEALSDVMERVYQASPVVKNELINRDKISSQAAAARNKLLSSMLARETEEDLGIDKYPAEKGIYRAVLQASGLHRIRDGRKGFGAPTAEDPYNFRPVWTRIELFLEETERSARPFTDLDSVLCTPPYGVKAGVLPILYVAAYLSHQHEVALFEEGHYVPYLTEDQLERFVRRPADFSVQSFYIKGLRASIFQEYAQILYGDADSERTLLSIARPLAKFLGDLPDYTKATKRLSVTTHKVREAFVLAKSPAVLLFEALPKACGLQNLTAEELDEQALREFSEQLKGALRELKYAYPNLLDEQHRLLAQAFGFDRDISLDDLRAVLRGRVEGLDNYTVDVEGLRAFIRRVAKAAGTTDEWFANLLLFLGQKPARKWSDTEADAAEFRLSEFARRLNDLRKLSVHYDGERLKHGTDFDVVLLRTIRKGGDEREELVCIDHKTREASKNAKAAVVEQLNKLSNRELKLSVLAELAEEFLKDSQRSTIAKHRQAADNAGEPRSIKAYGQRK